MNSHGACLVSAGPDDLEAVMAIEQRCQSHPWSREVMLRYLSKEHVVWRLELDGTLIGFAVVTQIAGEAELLDIAIDPDYQGRGFGQQLLQRLLDDVGSKGNERMFLEVRASNMPAIAVYEKLGFCQIGVRRNYYPAKIGREDALMYCQELFQ
ncbi:ribosomal protein S18-alanine N-acetyltransferase [Oceanobacter sp. 5_MG-2023]|uniref:ribosomal protein S18-alanine N-acetyltransferase n=1 Tax=Oceanobacter sp. 5_MG-2023 TaxID=3062645 RepID=UPI0026E2D49A|nr:ribosomal protein S18-alanine N-acetyltransferase [Oceanobacter sp. 5_MG-2023]MDO6682024.1 ribosomal protein S18-alanine N-acetyltransferase [Oceanobacter sp. 5_MG-2023]